MHAHQFTTSTEALTALTAGNATITIVSEKTGARFTFKVQAPRTAKPGAEPVWFVSVLTGSNNESDFTYVGLIRRNGPNGLRFNLTSGSKLDRTAPSVKAIDWTVGALSRNAVGAIPAGLQVWHEGRCCRCGRKLTVPESLASGLGPECAERTTFKLAA